MFEKKFRKSYASDKDYIPADIVIDNDYIIVYPRFDYPPFVAKGYSPNEVIGVHTADVAQFRFYDNTTVHIQIKLNYVVNRDYGYAANYNVALYDDNDNNYVEDCDTE